MLLYEQSVPARPVGWPEHGYAALAHLTELARQRDGRPKILHHAILQLDLLAHQMHAIATLHDDEHLAKQIARARRRRQPPAPGPWTFRGRVSAWPHWAALDDDGAPIIIDGDLRILKVLGAPTRGDEDYRTTLRDAYLVAGHQPPPHVDGHGARADRGAYDPDSDHRRAQPPYPYPTPDRFRDDTDPLDRELSRLSGMPLRYAQRLDIDERDRRLATHRAIKTSHEKDARDTFWAQIRDVADLPRDETR